MAAPRRAAGALAWILLAACGAAQDADTPPQPIDSVETPKQSKPAATSDKGDKPAEPAGPPVGQTATAAKVEPDAPKSEDAPRIAELSAVAGTIVDAFTNTSPRVTPDGKRLVFRSNRDGLPQLYVADAGKPGSAATRLVELKERVGSFEITQDSKSVIFLSDKGADENYSIFRVGIDGSGLTELTKGETLQRDPPFLSDQPPGTMIYSARAVKEQKSRLYVQQTDSPLPKLAYTDPKAAAFAVHASRDGKQALLVSLASLSESTLLLADIAAGTAKPIYPAEGKHEYVGSAAFSADSSTIFVSTDGGGEQAILLALDAKSLAEKSRYVEEKPKTALIEDFAVSKKGDLLGLLINAGNRTEVRLLDQKTLKPGKAVTMPLGFGSNLRFTDDGKLLTLNWSTPNAPTDLYAVDTQTGKSRPLRKEARPSLAKLPDIDASITEIASFDGKKVPLNIYLPKGLAKGKKLPTLVIVHGGPASSYAVRWSPFTRFYSAQGFAVVEPNVRGSTGFGRAYEQAADGNKRMDAVKDLEAVGKWVAAQAWADADKLVVLGGSYGGYMTLMGVSHQSALWKAGVDIFGIYNWRTFMSATSGAIRDIFQKELGTENGPAFLESISPSSAVDKIAVPLFVYAGQNDPRVPRSESDQIVGSLRARGVPVEYMVAMDEGHSLDRKENIVAFLARSTRFLEKTLKLGK